MESELTRLTEVYNQQFTQNPHKHVTIGHVALEKRSDSSRMCWSDRSPPWSRSIPSMVKPLAREQSTDRENRVTRETERERDGIVREVRLLWMEAVH